MLNDEQRHACFVIRVLSFLRHWAFDIRHSEGLPDKSADGKVLPR
jgi:hypothetical protein